MGKLDKKVLFRTLKEAMGIGVALACIGWALAHLIVFFSYGYVLVGESNKFLIIGEIALTSIGLLCLLTTFCKDKLSSKK